MTGGRRSPRPEAPVPADAPGVKNEQHRGLLTELERMPASLWRELGHLGSQSPFDRPITGSRELAFSVGTLAEMKAIGAAMSPRATVNDVLTGDHYGGLASMAGYLAPSAGADPGEPASSR